MIQFRNITVIFCLFLTACGQEQKQESTEADICIYGGTSAGVIAAYTASKQNKKVILIEPGLRLGGLSSGGLGYTDIGNKYAISGLSRDFYRRVGQHYGKFEQWIFEPHVADSIFQDYIKRAGVEVIYRHVLADVEKEDGAIHAITVADISGGEAGGKKTIKAKVFIDCSYEGDLMAKAGVSYTVGREANSLYGETYNGVQLREKHQFPDGIDPYKIPGNPESGLLWGISDGKLAEQGEGDKKVQAYNFRICLSNQPDNMIPITRPDGYDSSKYELLLRVLDKKPAKDLWGFLKFDLMPNNKTDINNMGAFSTDMIGMNEGYVEGDYATRKEIIRKHEEYTRGLLYFIGHDPGMPLHLREQMLRWGYPRDEYAENGNWSPQLYVREARRMIGAYVMTQANCEGRETVTDEAGMAAYTMDSHNCQRLVVDGMVRNEGDVQIGGFGPYPVAYRSLIPKAGECSNLLVPVCLSATHIAYGSIRMEPVFMVLAQTAATAACLAIDGKHTVQDVPIEKIREVLTSDPLADQSTPEILVDDNDSLHVKVSGEWEISGKSSYGPSLYTGTGNGSQAVRFTPSIRKAGKYGLYTYLPKLDGLSSVITVRVFDGSRTYTHLIRPAELRVEGQTSGEWVSLGEFNMPEGAEAYAEITRENADGLVVADAMLFIPE